MNDVHEKWSGFLHKISAGILMLLGFSGCDRPFAAMYGSPTATYKIKGEVADEDGKPVTSAGVIVRSLGMDGSNLEDEDFYESAWLHDTVKVDRDGKYSVEISNGEFRGTDFRIVVEDMAHKPDSVEVTMTPSGGDKDNVWDMGSAEETVNFILEKLDI